jgi:hypothetical protein
MNETDFRYLKRLYHGSDVAVRTPDPFFSTIKKDFGQGFYVSADKHSAELWAKRVYHRNLAANRRPIVNAYDFSLGNSLTYRFFDGKNESDLDIWIDYIVYNRKMFAFLNNPLSTGFDMVVGLIADGEWVDLFEPFERRVRSERDYLREKGRLLEDLIEIEASRQLGYQCCFKTPSAILALKYDAGGSYHV